MADLGRKHYYNRQATVTTGAVNQEVDLLAAIIVEGRDKTIGAATYLTVTTDVEVTMKINLTTADSITVDTTDGHTVPGGVMSISKLYFTHTGASSGSGDATVTIFAA